MAVKLKTK